MRLFAGDLLVFKHVTNQNDRNVFKKDSHRWRYVEIECVSILWSFYFLHRDCKDCTHTVKAATYHNHVPTCSRALKRVASTTQFSAFRQQGDFRTRTSQQLFQERIADVSHYQLQLGHSRPAWALASQICRIPNSQTANVYTSIKL